MAWGSSILTSAFLPMELWEIVPYFYFWWTTKATQLKIGVKSPGGSLLELTAFTAVIWMFTIPRFLDNIRPWTCHGASRSLTPRITFGRSGQVAPEYSTRWSYDMMSRYHDFSMRSRRGYPNPYGDPLTSPHLLDLCSWTGRILSCARSSSTTCQKLKHSTLPAVACPRYDVPCSTCLDLSLSVLCVWTLFYTVICSGSS